MFELNHNGNINGTGLQGYINTSYRSLIKLFGPGELGFDKCANHWIFTEKRTGLSISLYDYKYDASADKNYGWHVGAKDSETASLFGQWLSVKLGYSENKYKNYR